jgi:hypothetical protein
MREQGLCEEMQENARGETWFKEPLKRPETSEKKKEIVIHGENYKTRGGNSLTLYVMYF